MKKKFHGENRYSQRQKNKKLNTKKQRRTITSGWNLNRKVRLTVAFYKPQKTKCSRRWRLKKLKRKENLAKEAKGTAVSLISDVQGIIRGP